MDRPITLPLYVVVVLCIWAFNGVLLGVLVVGGAVR